MNDKNVKQVRRSIPVKYHHMVGCNISISSWTAVPREITTGFVWFSEDINFRPKCLSVQFCYVIHTINKDENAKEKNSFRANVSFFSVFLVVLDNLPFSWLKDALIILYPLSPAGKSGICVTIETSKNNYRSRW